jgi:hypothetical protein
MRSPGCTILATSTAADGVLVTFLPLVTTAQPAWVASAVLLAQSAASMRPAASLAG